MGVPLVRLALVRLVVVSRVLVLRVVVSVRELLLVVPAGDSLADRSVATALPALATIHGVLAAALGSTIAAAAGCT
jgi:hypothetical protein